MQIAVLSDLHLGAKNALDRFARRGDAEVRFLRLLTHLEHHVDRIVLLGDIFETLRGRVPGSSELELRTALSAYPEISRRAIEHPRYQLVQGNHDAVMTRVLGIPDFHRVEVDGMRLLFFHGHQLDPFARGNAPLSRLTVWLGGWLERLGVRMTSWIDHLQRPRPDGAKRPVGAFEHAAVALAEAERADIVITGHTHEAARLEINSTLYMNSGTCIGGRRELLLLDTHARRFQVLNEPDFDP
ncbi:MAG: UDP-2,3-diacylglucosamine diphosphatase [Deltaproteobacteria bacterium]|nr:UDP-2,3-diacylglucosamine diphosphatase [Deltaproteobacteria bacterium]